MAALDIHQSLCLSDNFAVLAHDRESGQTLAIDAPDANTIRDALTDRGWALSHILVTHHHADHTQGIKALKSAYGCTVIGPLAEEARIGDLDVTVREGDKVTLGSHQGQVIETPGHTLGHVSYYFGEAGIAFVGDTLFALGCGRVFEGDAAMMWRSLQKLAALDDETLVYCGHEYTGANARFALTIDADNAALAARATDIERKLAAGEMTLPTTIGLERQTNPFLRANRHAIKTALGLPKADDVAAFAELRRRKDAF